MASDLLSFHLLLVMLVVLSVVIHVTQGRVSYTSETPAEAVGGESPCRVGYSNHTGNSTTTLQNNCNCNCNCNPTVTCAPPVNETEMTSQLMQIIQDQQHQIQALVRSQENCNPVTKTTTLPRDCHDIRLTGETSSRAYDIYPNEDGNAVRVYCDMEIASEGWTVIQRREDGSINFNRSSAAYKRGFGNVNSEHWLGNDIIHRITTQGTYALRIELQDWDDNLAVAVYDKFHIGEVGTGFKLIPGRYSGGDAGDGLGTHSYQIFTTFDDIQPRRCTGGWWGFESCPGSNLNGIYYDSSKISAPYDGIVWEQWKGKEYSLKRSEMKIIPIL